MTDTKMKLTLDVAEQRRAKDAYMEARHAAMTRAGVLTSVDADEAGAEFDRIANIAVQEFIASLNAKDEGVAFALRTLENAIEGGTPEGPFRATPAEIERAREAYCDSPEDIEIDEVAFTSRTETGTWVQAWVWLPHTEE
jgi:hypothetical protein